MFDLERLVAMQEEMFLDIPATKGFDATKLQEIVKTCNLMLTKIVNLDKSPLLSQEIEYLALLSQKIITEKPFNSLNKRVALAAIISHLSWLQYDFKLTSLEAITFLNDIEAGLAVGGIASIIRENTAPF